jgi:hypothetical protein
MATTKSAAQVALEAGNSPKMLFENYRELVTEKAAKEYFGILPEKKGTKGKDKGNVKLSPKPPSTNNLRRCGHAARSKSPKQITRKK